MRKVVITMSWYSDWYLYRSGDYDKYPLYDKEDIIEKEEEDNEEI